MKKTVFLAAAAVALASCSSDELVNNSAVNEAPIAFNVGQKNITRAGEVSNKLEDNGHYNFGVWAYKYKTDAADAANQLVMENYLVGYSDGVSKGYAKGSSSTWSNDEGVTENHSDHKSPWFYEKLGKEEYKYNDNAGFYKASQTDFMSANDYQYLRYWDLAYNNTKFFAYAPYKASGVTFTESTKTISVDNGILSDGYSAPSNEFIYAGAEKENKNMEDVTLKFYHLGAQVKLRFYEDIPGYYVTIIDVKETDENGKGIQATPATYDESEKKYVKSSYYTVCGAEINYTKNGTLTIDTPTATATYGTDATSKSDANLEFAIPTIAVPEKTDDPTSQTYAESGTTYYPVPQPTDSKVGFTFHVSFTLKAKDNDETITVHDARVFVPAKSGDTFVAAWQPNTLYTYTFKITRDATGTTDPNDKKIDPTDPDIPQTKALYPIVFDGATIEEYKTSGSEQNF